MVHVSNAEGRRKMLAFSSQPENTILIGGDSKELEEASATTSQRISTNNLYNNSNILNLSCIIEEDSSSLTNSMMMTPDITTGNTTNAAEARNLNENNNVRSITTTTTNVDNNSNSNSNNPGGFANEISTTTTTESSQTTTVIRKMRRDAPDKLSHEESLDESEEQLEREAASFGSTTSGTKRKSSPPKSKASVPRNRNQPLNANISNEGECGSSPPSSSTAVKQSKPATTTTSKQVGLKRVSFGSSKGSMVETLVYESPVTEEHEITKTAASTSDANRVSLANGTTTRGADQNDSIDSTTSGGSTGGSRPPSRVRVTFFESEKPLAVSSPESDILDFDLGNMTLPGEAVDGIPHYNRQMSGEIGWENPFRPDGNLSKEADQIVELIKEGKPINDETLRSKSPSVNEAMNSTSYSNYNASPPGKGANGSAANGSGSVEVQRGVAGAQQVEHVVLKKKKGCCVIQ